VAGKTGLIGDHDPFFPGATDLSARLRAFDWSRTSIGPPKRWPENLRVAVRLCLTSPVPMHICWGPDRTIFCNDAQLTLLKSRAVSYIPGGSGRDTFPESWDTIGPAIGAVFETGEPVQYTDIPIRTGQTALNGMAVTFSFSPIFGTHQTVEGTFCVCTYAIVPADVTGLDNARRQAESASRAKDEFLAMLGHELRNPLAPILTALHLMRLKGFTDGERERTLIERQVNHLVALVDDLLDVSRITQGKIQLHKRRLHLADAVAKAIETTSPLLEERRHQLHIDVPRQPELEIDADLERFSQVVANLLTNAAKYTEAGGRIWVTAASERDDVVLRVRDNGIGISPEILPRVFDSFTQEPQALDRARGGLGLGLSIVRSLVEMHGGRVTARSEGLRAGAEFEIRLPHAATSTASNLRTDLPNGTTPPQREGRLRILVVDDNQDAGQLLAESLQHQGHQTQVALDAVTALRIAGEFKPDVALLDIGLPGMDGYELGGRLRQIPGLSQLRLMAVTGYGQESDRQRSAAAGFENHLVKPVELAQLDQLVGAARHHRRERDAASTADVP
jgi:CheY-like chemotaxis protein